ncbi:sugar phosphate nucleotidyltransferase [Thermoproteota archaeon]
MKGIVLAGGTGARLYPLTKVTNKHLLPVGHKPMIFHPIEKLIEAGITEILIVTGIEHMGDVVALLGSGREFGCAFTYKVQDEAGGIAQALGLAKNFCNDDAMVVILGDNIFEDSIKSGIEAFLNQKTGARLFLKETSEPQRFGVPVIADNKIVKIEEKPNQPKSNYAVTGIYMYDNRVFDFIEKCTPSKRNELEITDVNNFYIEQDSCFYETLKGWWTDAGTFESLKHANDLMI